MRFGTFYESGAGDALQRAVERLAEGRHDRLQVRNEAEAIVRRRERRRAEVKARIDGLLLAARTPAFASWPVEIVRLWTPSHEYEWSLPKPLAAEAQAMIADIQGDE